MVQRSGTAAECRTSTTQGIKQLSVKFTSANANARATNETIQIPEHAQRFCSSFELLRQHFYPKQHLLPASEYHPSEKNSVCLKLLD